MPLAAFINRDSTRPYSAFTHPYSLFTQEPRCSRRRVSGLSSQRGRACADCSATIATSTLTTLAPIEILVIGARGAIDLGDIKFGKPSLCETTRIACSF